MRRTRTFLRVAAVACLVVASLPWAASPSYAIRVPETLFRLLRLTGDLTERSLPFAATDLGVTWRGSGTPAVRMSDDGESWTGWRTVSESEDMFDPATGTHYSELIDGRDARRVQVKWGTGLAVINTDDGPLRTVKLLRSLFAATGQPPVISRAEWGANESLRRGAPAFSRVKKIFVHHAVTPNRDSDPAATMRGMLAYHVQARGWDDIGYNFVIDRSGRIYEGRFARSYAPGEVPTGENPGGFGVVGAHTADVNTGSMGVAVLGNTNTAAPTAATMGGLTDLLSWHADRHGINPLTSDAYVNEATGATGSFPNIAGHLDSPFASTSCPGRHLYSRLPELRNAVESAIAARSPQSAPSMPTGARVAGSSPSDAMPDVTGDVSRTAVRVDVTFGGGLVPRTVSAAPAGGSFTVGDGSYGGIPLAPGSYSVTAVAFDAAGRASPAAPGGSFTVQGGGLLEGLLAALLSPGPTAASSTSSAGPSSGDPVGTTSGDPVGDTVRALAGIIGGLLAD
ncbi:MAG: N-acetylmuramoyl-L-alanine amidase [Actinomycetota bacterium]